MSITVESYKMRSEGILAHLDAASDMLFTLFHELDASTGDTQGEQEFYEDLVRQVDRAKKNLEVAKENIEMALDLDLVIV